VGIKMGDRHEVMVYAELNENINSIKKGREGSLVIAKQVDFEVHTEQNVYVTAPQTECRTKRMFENV
jgi:hypothetical protein